MPYRKQRLESGLHQAQTTLDTLREGHAFYRCMNTKFMGRLGLSDEEENALVSFMQTLTDGFMQR